jgi:putative DNA primase/helicase
MSILIKNRLRIERIIAGVNRWRISDGAKSVEVDADLSSTRNGVGSILIAATMQFGNEADIINDIRRLTDHLVATGADEAGLPDAELREAMRAMAGPDGRPRPVLTCMADVEAKSVDWLWFERIPLGRITLLVGRPGEGKSFLTTDITARVTRGRDFPDSSPCPRGSVILISAEDDPSDTIRPRLDAHNADVSKVHLLSGVEWVHEDGERREVMFTLANLEVLETAIKRIRPKLLVIDPIGSFLGGDADAHRDNDVRAVLAPVARLAEKYGVAVLIVAHRRKSGGTNADETALGSRAFTGIARAVWHLSRDPNNKFRRLLLPGKNNLSVEGTGLGFTIAGHPPALRWESEPVMLSADEGLEAENSAIEPRPGPEPKVRSAASAWLSALLAHGETAVAKVKEEAKGAEFAWRTVQRAADELQVVRIPPGPGGEWRWRLPRPEDANHPNQDANTPKQGELGILASAAGAIKNAVFGEGLDDDAKMPERGNLNGNSLHDPRMRASHAG